MLRLLSLARDGLTKSSDDLHEDFSCGRLRIRESKGAIPQEDHHMRRCLGILAVTVVALAATTAEAHHDFTLTYLADRTVTIEGELAQLLFRNPHTLVYLIVRDNRGRDVRHLRRLHPEQRFQPPISAGGGVRHLDLTAKFAVHPSSTTRMRRRPNRAPPSRRVDPGHRREKNHLLPRRGRSR